MLLKALRRRIADVIRPQRSLDAAGGGRRWRDAPTMANVSTIHAGAGTIAMRAQHFALNTSIGAKVVETLVSNIVGDGIKPRSQHPSEGTRNTLHRRFLTWTDEADADGRSDFYGLEQAASRDLVICGEALFQIMPDLRNAAPTLRRLHPEQLDRSLTRINETGNPTYQGVEFDRSGSIVAYHIRPHAPGDALAAITATPVRMPASEIIHLFRPLIAGQVRGLSWLAPILLPAKELDALADAMLVRAKVAALHAGFIYDQDGTPPYDGEQSGTTFDASLEPGVLVTLPPGKSIEFGDVPDQGGASGLMMTMMRAIAAGTGIGYEQLTGDYSETNYSSARAASLEFRRFITGIQHHVMVFQFCRPIWKAWIRSQVLAGTIPATAFSANRADFEAVKWLAPAWPWVDPQKDSKAAEIELNANLRSRSELIAERGYDAEEVDAEIAADAARLSRLGLTPTQPKETTK